MASASAILIAHKDPLARTYLRGVIERTNSTYSFHEATSFNDLVDCLTHQPATPLALIDIDLPEMAAELGMRFLATRFPQSRFVALYSALATERIEMLAAAGVVACVLKDLSDGALVRAFEAILAGRTCTLPGVTMPEDHAEPVKVSPAPSGPVDHELTERQNEVLRLLALGRSNREIAQMLNIAEGTVKVHVNAAFRVLGVHNRASAAAAIRQRLADPPREDHRGLSPRN